MNSLRRLVNEAHRRSVWQVLGIYVLGAWIGYQVILNVMQGFGLPDWVAPFSLVLFLIGLPVVVATAFVQEGMPERRDFERRAVVDPHDVIPGFATASDELNGELAPVPVPVRASPATRHLTWPKALLGGIGAFLVLGFSTAGYMGLRNAGIGPMGTLLGRGELSDRDPIVLAQFTTSAGDGELAAAVTEAFRVDFEQSPIVRLVGPQQIADVLRRMQRDASESVSETLAREIVEREGYKAVLSGEVNSVGGGYVLSARLLSADGRVLASARETAADSTMVLAAIDGLSETLRERIGESLRTIRANQPLEQVTTSSMEALRKYTQSLRAREEGDPLRALELLENAIAIDSTFAMAWRKMGAILLSPGMDDDLRVRATTRAYELRDRLTEREQHLAAAAYYAWVTGDGDAAMREYLSVLDLDPDNTTALNNLAIRYTEVGRYQDAVQLTGRAVEIGGSTVFFNNHAEALYSLGRTDEARAVLARAAELYPTNHAVELYRAALEAAEGRYAASDSIIDAVLALTGPDPVAAAGMHWQRSTNAALRGRVRDAVRATHVMERTAAYSDAEALGSAVWRAQLLRAMTGDADRARRELDDALARYDMSALPPLERPYGPIIELLLLMGDDTRARDLMRQRDAAIPADQRASLNTWYLRAEAHELIRAGELERAEAVLEELEALTPCDLCMLPFLADAHARAGDPRHAIELYDRYLAERYFWRAGEAYSLTLARVLIGNAEAHEQIGDTETAARHYARFVELWQDADAELQPRVRAARARLEAIVSRRG